MQLGIAICSLLACWQSLCAQSWSQSVEPGICHYCIDLSIHFFKAAFHTGVHCIMYANSMLAHLV